MKKIDYVIICVLLCMNLGGCIRPMSRGEQLTKQLGSEHQIADQMMEDIATALDAGDADALKSLFSKTALKEAPDIGEQISDVLKFYEGKTKDFSGFLNSSTSTDYGKESEKEITGHYTLTTDKEVYKVCYIYRVIDKEEPDNEGLSKLEIVEQSLYDNEDFHWQFYTSEPGVYIQK